MALGVQALNWSSGFWSQIFKCHVIGHSGSEASDLGLSNAAGILWSPACRGLLWDFPVIIITQASSTSKFPPCLPVHIFSLALFLWRALTNTSFLIGKGGRVKHYQPFFYELSFRTTSRETHLLRRNKVNTHQRTLLVRSQWFANPNGTDQSWLWYQMPPN